MPRKEAGYQTRQQPKIGEKIVKGVIVGTGDKQVVIDPKEVQKLAELHATWEEMSDYFGVPRTTLQYNFDDIIKLARASTKCKLRKKQIDVALKGNPSMLIWLGKNMLGQRDKFDDDVEIEQEITKDDVDKRILEIMKKATNGLKQSDAGGETGVTPTVTETGSISESEQAQDIIS